MTDAASILERIRAYHAEVVQPILDRYLPGLPYAAARLGGGSEILGLDDATSRDHDWGLRLVLLAPAATLSEVRRILDAEIPASFDGLPTRFGVTWRPEPSLGIEVAAPESFVRSHLGVDATAPLPRLAWLSLTGQAVLELTAGPVFADRPGVLTAARERLAWYPDDVWRFVLAGAWRRIDDELPFVGRTALRGDDVGSRILAARLARGLGQIAFLLERRWAPYAKWFGIVLRSLPTGQRVTEALGAALRAEAWTDREDRLIEAVEVLAARQREVGLSTADPAVQPFHDRPFRTVSPEMVELLLAGQSDELRRLGPVGGIEQWADGVPALVSGGWRTHAVRGWTAR